MNTIYSPVYLYRERHYTIVSKVKIKNPQTRKWDSGILYRPVGRYELYVREETEFFERFKLESHEESGKTEPREL